MCSVTELHTCSVTEIHKCSVTELHTRSVTELHTCSLTDIHTCSVTELHTPSVTELHTRSLTEIHTFSVTELYMCSVTERHTCSVVEIYRYSVTKLHTQYAVLQGTLQEIFGPINCTRGDKGDAVYQLQRLLGVTKTIKAWFNPTRHWSFRVPLALMLKRTGNKIRTNITLRRVHVTVVTVEKQLMLRIVIFCL